MMIFVFDRNKNIIGYFTNNGAEPKAPFFNDIYRQELATGAESYLFTTKHNTITKKLTSKGNYILFTYQGKNKLFQIVERKDIHTKGEKNIECYCECIGLDLLTDYAEPFFLEGNITQFLEVVLQDSDIKLGNVDYDLRTNIQYVKNEKNTKVYNLIQNHLSTFGNVEIEFRTEIINNKIADVYLDVYKEGNRGRKTYHRFEYGENVAGITRKSNLYEFASAGIGEGENGLSFRDVVWSKAKGDPVNKPLGQNYVLNPVANDKFNKGDRYIKKPYTFQTKDKNELLRLTYEALLKDGEPQNDYEVDVKCTKAEFKQIRIGDTVYVCDFGYSDALLLEARVSILEVSFTDPRQNKCTLSNYKKLKSKIIDYNQNVILGNLVDYINSLSTGKLSSTQINQIKVYLKQIDLETSKITHIVNKLKDVANSKLTQEQRNKVSGTNIDVLLSNGRDYICERVKSIKYRLPNTANSKYKVTLKFTTEKDTSPTKFYQSTISWLMGTHCVNGALIPRADTTYTIKFTWDNNTTVNKKYLGVVTATSHGGSYSVYKNKTDYTTKIVECMKTYYDNRDKFKYNTTTPYSFKDPTTATNKAKWISNGKYHIDCSSFTQFVTRGITYINSTYNHNDKSPYYLSTKYKYPFKMDATISDRDRTASDQARYFIENGLALNIDVTNQSAWKNLQPGDFIFWSKRLGDEDAFETINDRYMQVGHVAIVSEVKTNSATGKIDVLTYESTTGTAIQHRWLSNNFPSKLLFFARPRR